MLRWRRWWGQHAVVEPPPLQFQEGSERPGHDQSSPQGQTLELTPWSIARLEAISRELQQRPSAGSLQAARSARGCLARFWLAAPVDALETLFAGPIGAVYRHLLAGVLPALPLDAAETAWKAQLTAQLQLGFARHGSVNVFLALLPYLDREVMQVHDPLRHLPGWLLPLYAERCEPGLSPQPTSPPPQLQPAPALAPSLPTLAPITGVAGMALIGDADFLGRINGLIKLYELEPSDPEIVRDLSLGRRQVAQVWLDVETEQLEALYRTPFGKVTEQLIRSGFAREPLGDDERALRQHLVELAADLGHPRALNALIAAGQHQHQGQVEQHQGSDCRARSPQLAGPA